MASLVNFSRWSTHADPVSRLAGRVTDMTIVVGSWRSTVRSAPGKPGG